MNVSLRILINAEFCKASIYLEVIHNQNEYNSENKKKSLSVQSQKLPIPPN
jgi:hypothetical protein